MTSLTSGICVEIKHSATKMNMQKRQDLRTLHGVHREGKTPAPLHVSFCFDFIKKNQNRAPALSHASGAIQGCAQSSSVVMFCPSCCCVLGGNEVLFDIYSSWIVCHHAQKYLGSIAVFHGKIKSKVSKVSPEIASLHFLLYAMGLGLRSILMAFKNQRGFFNRYIHCFFSFPSLCIR